MPTPDPITTQLAYNPIAIQNILYANGFFEGNGRQEGDAQEFLEFVFNKLNNEILKLQEKYRTPMNKIFSGKLRINYSKNNTSQCKNFQYYH